MIHIKAHFCNDVDIMKKSSLLALSSAILVALMGLTSCNKEEKKVDQVVGKFEVKDASSPVSSIELTADGEYIITKNTAVTKSAESEPDLDDVWVYGNFSFADGTYILEGFGKIVIDALKGGNAEISITGGGWDPFTVNANLASTVAETEINKSLCRHWVFEKTRYTVLYNNMELLNFELAGCDFTEWFKKTGDEQENDDLDEKCTGLIFTESGTYAVVYDGGKVNVGSWAWENGEDGSLACNWDSQYSSWFKDYRFHGSLTVDVDETVTPAMCVITHAFDSSMENYDFFTGTERHDVTARLIYYLRDNDYVPVQE